MADNFVQVSKSMESPATRHFSITANDSVPLAVRPRALYVLTTGNLVIKDESNVTLTYPVVAGQVVTFRAMYITTASTATVVGWE